MLSLLLYTFTDDIPSGQKPQSGNQVALNKDFNFVTRTVLRGVLKLRALYFT